jgi:hypothetical protein
MTRADNPAELPKQVTCCSCGLRFTMSPVPEEKRKVIAEEAQRAAYEDWHRPGP